MDGQTERCAHCGTPSTEGRYCTNCGAELGTEPTNPRIWGEAGDTAERTYGVTAPAHTVTRAAAAPTTYASPLLTDYPEETSAPRGPGLGPGLWAGLAAVMVLALVVGGYLFLHGLSSGTAASTPLYPSSHPTSSTPKASSGTPSGSPTPSPSAPVQGPPTNVAGFAQASAPRQAPPAVDFAGHRVTYAPSNLVDGRNDTCWRTPGNASGMVLTFRLDQPTVLSRVGLVNGYAKIAYDGHHAFDWYTGNRRVLAVDWIFDDGTTVHQSFRDSRTMQQLAIRPVTTRTVRLKITSVSAPGRGPAARNDTAISEVLLQGMPA